MVTSLSFTQSHFTSDFKMTRRKFKPCPSCQAPNQLSRKTCSSCFTTISKKPKVMAKKVSLDRKWGERVLKNRNAGRVVDSAYIAVKKLSSLGYVPILFFARKDKASGKWVADVVTHLPPTEDNLKIVATMRKAYHFLLIKEGCRKCSRQQIFKYDSITGTRMNEGQSEVRVKWLPCM
ncbi:hypothetical protein PFLUV_G00228160 [Perca fluviatilis]|uniref:Uncharacterized protein n=1 Tax=Perca fluviatilis TaxID=8168 RepID=A0A6A5E234_PERFL|nr:hypothetical protein PFLUV_G00228160 [Perca fluviatilis]